MKYSNSDTELNTEVLHDLLSSGTPKKQIAMELGISVSSLNKTIEELQSGQGLLLKYKELQNLQLTNLQAKILDAITPEKIQGASLIELVNAFKILKDKELVITGKANNITGIVGYLVELEKEEARKNEPYETGSIIEITTIEEALETCAAYDLSIDVENNLPNL